MEILFEIEPEDLIELQAFGSSGGKSRIAEKLVSLIPKHKTYLEPFAGGAAVFWKKEPAKISILNDKNSEIAFAYMFIRDCTEEQLNRLKQMNWVPNKSTFFKLRDSAPPRDPVQRFYRFYYVQAYSYGLSSKTYGYKTKKVGIFNRIPKLKKELKGTKVYNLDYSKILTKYNSEDAFAYLDPPYPKEWAGPEGTKIFSKKDTQKLHDILKNFKGKFLLSINNLDWIKKMFSDFKISKIKVPRSFRKGDPPKYELLVSNYDIKTLATGVSTAPVSAGSPISSPSLQPTIIGSSKKKKKKKLEIGTQKITYEEESEKIRENKKKPEAFKKHKFKPAVWTHKNGHPRCLICGDEETLNGYCEGLEQLEESKIELLKPYLPQKPAGSSYYDLDKFIEALK